MPKIKNLIKNHMPIRTCIVTRERKPKNELIRLALDKQGKVQIDLKGKIRGRGANISPSMEILEQGFEKQAIKKSLKLDKDLPESEKDRIREEFAKAIEEKQFRPTNRPVKIRVKKQELETKINGNQQ